jgi:excisionase family DNA binding protein
MSLQSRFKKPSQPAPSPIPFSGPRLLNLKQAASYLGQSVDLVRKLIDSREIPHVPKGAGTTRQHVLIDRFDLDAFIDKKKRGVVAA